jgi:hypothetical protein
LNVVASKGKFFFDEAKWAIFFETLSSFDRHFFIAFWFQWTVLSRLGLFFAELAMRGLSAVTLLDWFFLIQSLVGTEQDLVRSRIIIGG